MALEGPFRGQKPWWRAAPDGFWDSLLDHVLLLGHRSCFERILGRDYPVDDPLPGFDWR